ALVESGPPGDEINVDAKPFAEARDLVDERHLGSEESVRNVLDHFRRTQVRDNHGAVDSLVKGCYARRGSLVFSAHDNSVRVEKVMHAASFAEELGVGCNRQMVLRPGEGALEDCVDGLTG